MSKSPDIRPSVQYNTVQPEAVPAVTLPAGKIQRRPVVRLGTAALLLSVVGSTVTLASCSSSEGNGPQKSPTSTSTGATPEARPATPAATSQGSGLPEGKQYEADYKIAADVVWNAWKDDAFADAGKRISMIKNYRIKAGAVHGVDTAKAENAAWDAWKQDTFSEQEKLLDEIKSPDVKKRAEHAVDVAESEGAMWSAHQGDIGAAEEAARFIEDPALKTQVASNINRAKERDTLFKSQANPSRAFALDDAITSDWANLDDQAAQKWSELDDLTAGEWSNLYDHTKVNPSTQAAKPKVTTSISTDAQYASEAVKAAGYSDDLGKAEELVKKIANPSLRAQASYAVDAERAEQAVSTARYGSDLTQAEKEIDAIKNPALRQQAETAVDYQEAHDAVAGARYGSSESSKVAAGLVENSAIKALMTRGLQNASSDQGFAVMDDLDGKALDARIALDDLSTDKRLELVK